MMRRLFWRYGSHTSRYGCFFGVAATLALPDLCLKRTNFHLAIGYALSMMFSRSRFGVLLALLCALLWGGDVARADIEKVRRAVPFPQMEARFEFEIGNFAIARLTDDEARLRIAAIEAAPDASPAELLEMARLSTQLKDYPRAKSADERALTILRPLSEQQPPDGAVLVQLGRAYRGLGQLDEAEAISRRATQIAPQLATAWSTLAEMQMARAEKLMVPTKDGYQISAGATTSFTGLSEALLGGRPTPETMAQVQTLLTESLKNGQQAVQVAPLDPDVYLKRWGLYSNAAFLNTLLNLLRARDTLTLKAALGPATQLRGIALYSPPAIADLQTIARLRPDNATINGAAALYSIVSFAQLNGRELPLPGSLEALPATVADPVRQIIERLETLSNGDAKTAAPALEALGVVFYMVSDTAAVETLRRAIALDPTRPQASEILIGLLASDQRYAEVETVARAQLKIEDTVRAHLVLAKALDAQERPQEVPAQISAALALAPDDLTANLARAALLLRANDLAPASEQLTKVAQLMQAQPAPPAIQQRNYALLQAVLLALQGQTAAAQTALQAILTAQPKSESAQKLLDALNG